MEKPKGKTLSQAIADQLAEEIVMCRIQPGERMDEQSLADRFGVSRSPVRDALRQLTVTHLVHYLPRRGFSAASVKPSELDELFEAAGEIETLCAKLCALRAGPTERRRIERIHQSACEAAAQGDTTKYAELNEELHKLIYAGAHNKVLQELAILMRHRLAPFRAQGFFRSTNRMERSNKEHEELVAAVLSQDAEAAARMMYNHATNSASNVLRHFEEREGS